MALTQPDMAHGANPPYGIQPHLLLSTVSSLAHVLTEEAEADPYFTPL